jgi:hypothetical protein
MVLESLIFLKKVLKMHNIFNLLLIIIIIILILNYYKIKGVRINKIIYQIINKFTNSCVKFIKF